MPVYEFRCEGCATLWSKYQSTFDPPPHITCKTCRGTAPRVYSPFAVKKSMPEHYNVAAGRHVSNMRELRETFKVQSEAATARTGLEHNIVPVDPADAREVYGITDEGLDDQHRRHVDLGRREVKKWL